MISWGPKSYTKKMSRERREEHVIHFSDWDLVGFHNPNNNAVVMSITMTKHDIKKILVDSGSLANILFYDSFV